MPPVRQALKPGQLSPETIRALESYVVEECGEPARYRQMIDPLSLQAAGVDNPELPHPVPRFTLVVDTAEPDYELLVARVRSMGYWAVARSMRRPLTMAHSAGFFAGDFAVVEYGVITEEEVKSDDDDSDETEYRVPTGYRVLTDAERKTIPDLISSFTDGRRARQRADHANSSALRHVYLIEGNVNELTDRRATWIRHINSDLDHLTYSGPFRVRQINTHADLLGTLVNMVRYSAQDVLDSETGVSPLLAYSLAGKSQKARDLSSPSTVWSGMLQAVPGLSAAAATAIMDLHYPTLLSFARDLVAAADSDEARIEMVENLRNTEIPTQNSSSSRHSTRLCTRADKLMCFALGLPQGTELGKKKKKRSAKKAAEPVCEDVEPLSSATVVVAHDSDSDDDDSDCRPVVKRKRPSRLSSLWDSDLDNDD